MPLELTPTKAILTGEVGIDCAEDLLVWLQDADDPEVDITECSHAHMSILQILIVAQPRSVSRTNQSFVLPDWRAVLRDLGVSISITEAC